MMFRCFFRSRCLAPVAACAFVLSAGAAVLGDDAAADDAAASSLPTAEQVIQAHIDAIGGEEAVIRHSSRTSIGTIEIPDMEIEGEIKIFAAAPNLFLMEAELGSHGRNRTGFNGALGWTLDEINGPALLRDAQYEELRRQADFYADLNVARNYKSMQVLGRSMFEKTDCYELKLVDRSGKDVFAYYSVDSGLQIGLKGMLESHLGPIPTTTVFSEYKRFDGILLPTRLDTTFMNIKQRITITSVDHEQIESERFDLPEEIAALRDEKYVKDDEPSSEEDVQDADDAEIGDDDAAPSLPARPARVRTAAPLSD